MNLSLIRSMTRSAVFELENGKCFRPEHPFTVALNGKTIYESCNTNVFSLFSLTPSTSYTVEVDAEGEHLKLDFTTEAELAAAEQMITAGCEGIYFIPMDTAANLQVGNACRNGNVYWAISNRDILDEDIKQTCYANPYMVTHIWDASYQLAKDMVKVLADQGIKKVCMISGDPKDAMMVERNNGFKDGCAEYGIEILGTFQSDTDAKVITDGVSNFLTLYPNMEAILAVSGTAGVGEAIISTLEGSGREAGSIKLATFDTFDGNKEAFEKGWLATCCGGYTSECLVSFLSLVNRVKGNAAPEQPMKLALTPIMITSVEEMEIFSEYVDNPEIQLYSDEDILAMVQPLSLIHI